MRNNTCVCVLLESDRTWLYEQMQTWTQPLKRQKKTKRREETKAEHKKKFKILKTNLKLVKQKTLKSDLSPKETMIQGLWVSKHEYKAHKPITQSLGWGYLHFYFSNDGFISKRFSALMFLIRKIFSVQSLPKFFIWSFLRESVQIKKNKEDLNGLKKP